MKRSRERPGTLVAGFGPFGEVRRNPAESLARRCGRPFHVVPVAFEAAERFLRNIAGEPFDRLVILGIAAKSSLFRLERLARNHIGARVDNNGCCQPGPIDPAGPESLRATLWNTLPKLPEGPATWSDDAGDYLCNFIFYRALQAFPDRRVGFLHVPPRTVVPMSEQHPFLRALLEQLERASVPSRSGVPARTFARSRRVKP